MTAERIVSLDARRAQRRSSDPNSSASATARHATTLWTAFRASEGGRSQAESIDEDHAGALRMRIVLVLLSIVGTLLAITAWFTRGLATGLGIYVVTLCAIGYVLWRGSRGATPTE